MSIGDQLLFHRFCASTLRPSARLVAGGSYPGSSSALTCSACASAGGNVVGGCSVWPS